MQRQISLNSGNAAVLQRLLLQHCIQKGFKINSHSPGTAELRQTGMVQTHSRCND